MMAMFLKKQEKYEGHVIDFIRFNNYVNLII